MLYINYFVPAQTLKFNEDGVDTLADSEWGNISYSHSMYMNQSPKILYTSELQPTLGK